MVTQTAIDAAAKGMGVVAPDDALRQAVFDIPQFRGPDGQFNRTTFEGVLRNAGLTENRFLALMRQDLVRRQLMEAVRAGIASPETMTQQVFEFQQEKRVADAVELPFASAAAPPAPTDEQLRRWYDNHPQGYSTAELRHVKAVVLAPETVAHDVQVTDADLHAAYDQHRADYNRPEKRTIQVVNAPDEAHAKAIADAWRAGADWAAVQKAAADAGATAVELPDAAKIEVPSPELGDAAFAAAPDTVSGPVQGPLGWQVLRVTHVTGGDTRGFEQVQDELRARVLADKGADLVDERAQKVEDLLAGGTPLDELPADMGLAAVTGTLDAQGQTADGRAAPIPGPPELRPALIQAAFQAKKGDPAKLVQAPAAADGSQSFYAVAVDDITPPAPKPFDEVKDAVRADWTRDAIRREQNEAATRIYTAVKGGQSLEDAAAIAGVAVRRLPPTGRSQPADGVPSQLVEPLFGLKKGEATMAETADGFVVAVLADIQEADAKTDPLGFGQTRDALARAFGDDVENVFASAVRDRAKPTINRAAVEGLAQAAD